MSEKMLKYNINMIGSKIKEKECRIEAKTVKYIPTHTYADGEITIHFNSKEPIIFQVISISERTSYAPCLMASEPKSCQHAVSFT